MPKKLTKEQQNEILNYLEQNYSVTAIMRLCNVGSNSVYRIAKKNGIDFKKNDARIKYSENIIEEVRARFEKGETKIQISKEMHINPTSISNFLERKIRKISIKENSEYLKKYFEGWDTVSLVKFQNLIRKKTKIFEETLVRVGSEIFKTNTVIKYIDGLTPGYYCDFWR